MKIKEIRIYAEVLEQGLDFKEYVVNILKNIPVKNIYNKKLRGEFTQNDSIVDRLRKVKNIDVLITAISDGNEYPLLMVEYSTAVPTDDHKMQRSDVYFWGAVLKTPMMKISPSSKGLEQNFGGGSKFTDELEIAMAYKTNAIYYPIHWKNEPQRDVLQIKNNSLSCIYYSKDIENILTYIFKCFDRVDNFYKYYDTLQDEYIKSNSSIIHKYSHTEMKSLFTNSTRFCWIKDKLMIKINRFGHAMDPDRGALYFINMLVGAENVITEIQVNRPILYKCKGGYSTLFDALSCKYILKEYVQNIIKNGNKFTDENAIYIFKTALNIDDSLRLDKIGEHEYIIKDEILTSFLFKHPGMTSKCIFFLSTELRLTDVDRKTICSIKWNSEPIKDFINNIPVNNFSPTKLLQLSSKNMKEDIVTFASVELYRRIKCNLLAVSYPGAQGDRCVLMGSGRKTLRTYIDIIAYKNSDDGTSVYLGENKDLFAKSHKDVLKLKNFKTSTEHKTGLKNLFYKIVSIDSLSEIYTSVGAKKTESLDNLDVDYIFMFSIDDKYTKGTKIDYSVAIINTKLMEDFLNICDNEGRLKGSIFLNKVYCTE